MKTQRIITPADIRKNNRLNLLRCLHDGGVQTIAELAKTCNTTIVTLGKIIQELVNKGVIAPVKNESSEVGRHGSSYKLDAGQGLILCFDLTFKDRMFADLFTVDSVRAERISLPVEGERYGEVFEALCRKVSAAAGSRAILGAGISSAGIYDAGRDFILSSRFPWYESVSFGLTLRSRFGTQNVMIGQDVSFAALAESQRRLTGRAQSLYYLYVGDGVGGAFVKGRKLHGGIDGIAGDIGQTLVLTDTGPTRLEVLILNPAKASRNAEALLPLFAAIHNLLWVLNPDYLVISASDSALAERIGTGAQDFLAQNQNPAIPLSTRIQVSGLEDASLQGLLSGLREQYFASL